MGMERVSRAKDNRAQSAKQQILCLTAPESSLADSSLFEAPLFTGLCLYIAD
jgi:hypothetical protein